jgi:hypothetical protein
MPTGEALGSAIPSTHPQKVMKRNGFFIVMLF